jgi:hypothetical protein
MYTVKEGVDARASNGMRVTAITSYGSLFVGVINGKVTYWYSDGRVFDSIDSEYDLVVDWLISDNDDVYPCVVDENQPIVLIRCPNGGWVIEQGSRDFMRASFVGAYSDTKDMVAALSAALLPKE